MDDRYLYAAFSQPVSPMVEYYPLPLRPETPPPELPRWRWRVGRLLPRFLRRFVLRNRAYEAWNASPCRVWEGVLSRRFQIVRILTVSGADLDVKSFQVDGKEMLQGPLAFFPSSYDLESAGLAFPAGSRFRVELAEAKPCWQTIVLIGRLELES